MYTGSIVKGDVLMQMLEELGTPIRDIVGDEPVEFADTFIRNYSDGQWINKERKRLTDAIDQAAGDDA